MQRTATLRPSATWQLILADLALILFLVTASAVAIMPPEPALKDDTAGIAKATSTPEVFSAAQALYRSGQGLPDFASWLDAQPRDPRASVTITALHRPGQESSVWEEARMMAQTARALGIRTRIVLREGARADVSASVGYDQPES